MNNSKLLAIIGLILLSLVSFAQSDFTPPDVSFVTGIDLEKWQKQTIVVTIECNDIESGCNSSEIEYQINDSVVFTGNQAYVTDNGINTLKARAKNGSGVFSDFKKIEIKIDKEKPIVTSEGAGWINSKGLTIFCSDLKTGEYEVSGCKQIFYSLNNSTFRELAFGEKILPTSSGIHSLKFYAVDNAGNISLTSNETVQFDIDSPLTTLNTKNLNQGPILNVNCEDFQKSGCLTSFVKVNGSVEFQAEGGEVNLGFEGIHKIEYWSIDNSGNIEEPKTTQVIVDFTAPTIKLTKPASFNNKPVNIEVECTDALSNCSVSYELNSKQFKIESGDLITLSEEGIYSFEVFAIDELGNTSNIEQINTTLDFSSPLQVKNFSSTSAGNSIILFWDKSIDNFSNSLIYNIYRRKISELEYSGIFTQTSLTSFTDNLVNENITYVYKVSGVDESGNESIPSEEISQIIFTEETELQIPNPVINLEIFVVDSNVFLSWDNFSTSPVVKYEIYSSNTNDNPVFLKEAKSNLANLGTVSNFVKTTYFWIKSISPKFEPSEFSKIAIFTPDSSKVKLNDLKISTIPPLKTVIEGKEMKFTLTSPDIVNQQLLKKLDIKWIFPSGIEKQGLIVTNTFYITAIKKAVPVKVEITKSTGENRTIISNFNVKKPKYEINIEEPSNVSNAVFDKTKDETIIFTFRDEKNIPISQNRIENVNVFFNSIKLSPRLLANGSYLVILEKSTSIPKISSLEFSANLTNELNETKEELLYKVELNYAPINLELFDPFIGKEFELNEKISEINFKSTGQTSLLNSFRFKVILERDGFVLFAREVFEPNVGIDYLVKEEDIGKLILSVSGSDEFGNLIEKTSFSVPIKIDNLQVIPENTQNKNFSKVIKNTNVILSFRDEKILEDRIVAIVTIDSDLKEIEMTKNKTTGLFEATLYSEDFPGIEKSSIIFEGIKDTISYNNDFLSEDARGIIIVGLVILLLLVLIPGVHVILKQMHSDKKELKIKADNLEKLLMLKDEKQVMEIYLKKIKFDYYKRRLKKDAYKKEYKAVENSLFLIEKQIERLEKRT